MNVITLLQPQRLVFGNGCAAQCVEWLAARGLKRILLVTSKSVRPQIQKLVEAVIDAGCTVVETRFVPAEPTVEFCELILKEAQLENADGLVGIGGGSVLDVAKLVAALTGSRQNLTDAFGIGRLQGRVLPLACLPTTAGAGSEVSPNAVLLDEAAELKLAVISPHLVPDAAFVDPMLTWSVPPSVTAATGLDALTHCIEAYANLGAHPIVDNYALQGLRLISRHLIRAVQNGADGDAREAVALGSLYGGLCLGPVNTAAIHALAYPLAGKFKIAHGVSNALLLPHVCRFNAPAAPERFAEIAEALGVRRHGDAKATAESGSQLLAEMVRECGVPQKLSDLGISRSALPSLAAAAMQVTRLLKNNVRPLEVRDAMEIYEAAF